MSSVMFSVSTPTTISVMLRPIVVIGPPTTLNATGRSGVPTPFVVMPSVNTRPVPVAVAATETEPQSPVTVPEDIGEKLQLKLLKVNAPLVIVGLDVIIAADAVEIPTNAISEAKTGRKFISFRCLEFYPRHTSKYTIESYTCPRQWV